MDVSRRIEPVDVRVQVVELRRELLQVVHVQEVQRRVHGVSQLVKQCVALGQLLQMEIQLLLS